MSLQKLSKNLQILYNLKTVTKSQNDSKKYLITFSVLYDFPWKQIFSATTRNYPKHTVKIKQDWRAFHSLKGSAKFYKNVKTIYWRLDSGSDECPSKDNISVLAHNWEFSGKRLKVFMAKFTSRIYRKKSL